MRGKNPNPRLAKSLRTYDVAEAARLYGCHCNTVRHWFKLGLRPIDDSRPMLIFLDLSFERIGITVEQIAAFDLPKKPRKENDRRALHVTETVEAEAMPAAVMRQLLRDHIEALLPEKALEVARAAEESEQALLGALAQMARKL
jgi:hypothetical protein